MDFFHLPFFGTFRVSGIPGSLWYSAPSAKVPWQPQIPGLFIPLLFRLPFIPHPLDTYLDKNRRFYKINLKNERKKVNTKSCRIKIF